MLQLPVQTQTLYLTGLLAQIRKELPCWKHFGISWKT